MDFRKLGASVGKMKKQVEGKVGDRAEPGNLKRDAKDLREILAGDGSLAEKAKEAKEKVVDRDAEAPEGDSSPAKKGKTSEEPAGGQ